MMSFDPRDELWNAAYNTYYDAFYEEIAAEKLINKWQMADEISKVIVAITASGSAMSGWALWNEPQFKYIWAIIAGIGAILALLHSTLGVSGRLKNWGDVKRWFATLRIDLETFRYRMSVNPDFAIDEFQKDFIEHRRRYNEGIQTKTNDILWSIKLEEKTQAELNKRVTALNNVQ